MNDDLKSRFARYRAERPRMHAFDVATALGVSEADLLATRVGDDVTALDGRTKELFEALPSLGVVKTMTRNATAVIERWGAFESVEIEGPMGQVVGEAIDMRLFLSRFGYAFAVEEPSTNGVRRSLQFFDTHGDSIHKVFLDDESRVAAYQEIVARHRTEAKIAPTAPQPAPAAERPDAEIDIAGLTAAWDGMRNTHEFFGLLRRFGVSRTQALRCGGLDRARPVGVASLESTLRSAAAAELPIMIFVGNRGAIQIHSGAVRKIERMHGWLNILDPDLNLHVRDENITSAWVVRKPTEHGIVTSLELFDAHGENVMLLFNKRAEGTVEDTRWRELTASLGALERAEVA